MTWLGYCLLLVGISWAGIGMLRVYALEKGMLDHPGKRSSHTVPTPRGGGFVFSACWCLLVGVFYYYHWLSFDALRVFVPAMMIAFLGFCEDFKGISAKTRFLIHILCAATALFIMGEYGALISAYLPHQVPLWGAFGVLVFLIVWMTNLFNFMDGSDGIAGCQAIIIFGVGGYLLFQHQATELGILSWSLVAFLLGFLIWNWPTARIFMGDSGSTFLGFLTALYAIISVKFYHMPIIYWVMLTMVFWFDATLTLVRRVLAGHKWREPHRLHAYQRLIQAGWSHQSVLLATIFVNLIISTLVVMVHRDPSLMPYAVLGALLLVTVCYLLVEYAKPMFKTFHKVHNDIPAPPLEEEIAPQP